MLTHQLQTSAGSGPGTFSPAFSVPTAFPLSWGSWKLDRKKKDIVISEHSLCVMDHTDTIFAIQGAVISRKNKEF